MTELNAHSDYEDLLGAYALDAVVGEEAEALELHVRDCPRCRATLAQFRETASLLPTGHAPARVEVWDGIVAALDDRVPKPLDMTRLAPRRESRSRRDMVLAAAAVLLVLALGANGVAQSRRIDRMQATLATRTILSSALAAEGDPASRRVDMRTADGKLLAHAVITPGGTGYVWSDGLPKLPDDRTYQLWAAIGTERISVGVLGPNPELVPFRVAGDVVGLAVTAEVAGGVVATKNQPTVTGLVVS